MIQHSGERPFVCDYPMCGKTFTQASVLKTHKKTVHDGIRAYKCDKCSKSCSNLSSLKKHIIVNHTDEQLSRNYVCDLCGKSFVQLYSLKVHKRTIHEGIRDYACEYEQCNKRFKDAHGLKAHSHTHTGEKPWFCDFCAKSFTSKSNLEKHKRSIHQGLRPHSCQMPECDRSFPNASALKRHSLSHTGAKPYSCEQCNKPFDRASELKSHEQECIATMNITTHSNPEQEHTIKVEPQTIEVIKTCIMCIVYQYFFISSTFFLVNLFVRIQTSQVNFNRMHSY